MTSKSFIIKSEYAEVTRFMSTVRVFLTSNDIPENVCSEIEMCLIEALNNVVKHSYKEKPGNTIEIKLDIDSSVVIITIKDNGLARTNLDKPKLEFDPDDINNLPESGMGLFIIDQVMDENNYSSKNGVNTFSMKKKIEVQ